MADLAVVVPAYAEDEVIARCVSALTAAAARVDGAVDIVVVANRDIRDLAEARVLRPGRNLGFAGGVMLGVRSTDAPFVATVNDDCIVEPESLQALVAAATGPNVGSAAGVLVFADRPGVVNSAGISVDAHGVASERLVGRPVEAVTAGDVFGASGGFALYRREMLDAVGGLDESFFAYLEDADLAWRARMTGWRAVLAPSARATHAHSAVLGHASAQKHYLVGRNQIRMIAKNATRGQLVRHGPAIVAYATAYVLFAAVAHRTLAPLRGRIAGLREWRTYRRSSTQRPALLDPPAGLRAALARDRAYRAAAS